MTAEPSSRHSAMGHDGQDQSGTSRQSVNVAPVACGPHSMRCPIIDPAAIRSRSPKDQPNSWTSAPSAAALSAARPVITMSAPRPSASAMGPAPM